RSAPARPTTCGRSSPLSPTTACSSPLRWPRHSKQRSGSRPTRAGDGRKTWTCGRSSPPSTPGRRAVNVRDTQIYLAEREALVRERDEARAERDAMQRNWVDAQDAFEELIPVVEAAKAF